MAEFVSLAGWLRVPQAEAVTSDAVISEAVIIQEPPAISPEDELIDDVCAQVRRFRAMLADAFDYVQSRGEPEAPLRVHVQPERLAAAAAIGLPLVADAALSEEDAVIELCCGSIDANLHVPLERLLVVKPPQ